MLRRADADVIMQDAAPTPASPTDTGTGFFVGLADHGSISGQLTADDAILGFPEFVSRHGDRQSYNGPEWDAVEAHFADGGSVAYFSRYAGPDAEKARITVPAAGPQFTAIAKSEGAWANGYDIAVAGGDVTIRDADDVVLETTTVETVGDLQAWAAQSSDYVDIEPSVALDTAISNSAARALAGGDDDRASAGDAERTAALARMPKDLGPGLVAIPGVCTIAAHTAIATHCRDVKIRFGYGDAPDTADADTAAAAGLAVRALGSELARHIQILDPWLIAPGIGGVPTRTIPPCGVQMGMAARSDGVNPPSRAIAGRNGISRFALDVKYNRTDGERDALAAGGVSVIRNYRGVVQTFDDITPVDPGPGVTPDPYVGAAVNRMIARIVLDGLDIAYAHMFGPESGPVDIDGFNGDLKGMLSGWLGRKALYSRDGTAAGAFRVETGPAVNTDVTIAQRKLRAAMAVHIAGAAREVEILLSNTPLQTAV